MHNILSLLLCGAFLVFFSQATGQSIAIEVVNDATELAQTLAGPNIDVYNATVTGNSQQSGKFSYAGNAFGVSSGVILSTGNVLDAEGPNSFGSTSTNFGNPGDAVLSQIAGFQTYDAVQLRFDFQVQSDRIEFSFLFGSEEYNEWVGDQFNDVFAFFISGPGINGEENIALVPTTNDGITINTINNDSYWQFYNDNEGGMTTHDIEFDGFTTLLKAFKNDLIPCEEYTLRLVIADGGDGLFDSGVLLQENSLVQGNVTAVSQTPNDDDTAIEGCIKASFTFSLDQPLPYDTEIELDIQGQAINGIDYAYIDNLIIIPAGETEITIFIDAFEDGLNEGVEDVLLIYPPSPCAEKDTVFLFIEDAIPLDYSINGGNLFCNNDESGTIDLMISGGYPPYWVTITPEDGPSVVYANEDLPITGLSIGTYLVEVDDVYGCAGDTEVFGALYDGGPMFLPDGNGEVYTTTLPVEGVSQTFIESPEDIQSICLNMEHSFLGDLEIKLFAPDGTELILKQRYNASDGLTCDLGEPIARAPKDGPSNNTDPGTGYDYCFTHNPVYGTMVGESNNYVRDYTDAQGNSYTDRYLPEGSYTPYQSLSQLVGAQLNGDWTLWIKDHLPQDNGWVFNWSISFSVESEGDTITLTEPDPINVSLVGEVTQAACNESDGSITINIDGDYPPFEFEWNTGETTQNISGLSAGVYTVIVSDNNECSTQQSFEVSNLDGPEINGIIQHQQCFGQNDASIETTFTGNITDISWNNGATTSGIYNLAPGTYTVEVTDDQNCKSVESFTIQSVSLMYLDATLINETCGNKNGEIQLETFGGTPPYSYLWNNGETTQNISFLNQGTYTVVVTDNNGCEQEQSFSLLNTVGQCLPNCDLTINSSVVEDEICGNQNGQVSLSIYTSNTPHTVSWSNGENGNTITNLSEGNYTATISDAEGCQLTETYTIINNAGSLAISSENLTNESCGDSNGAIMIDITGGDGNYSFNWNNGATTQNLSNISAGTYTVEITDGTSCKITRTYEIINNTGSMALSFQYVMDEVCGNGNGSIDINITPSGSYSYAWSNGATTQDLMNLLAGNYQCVITNNNTGCQLTTPVYEVKNLAGSLMINNIFQANEFCSNENGRIELVISGGEPEYSIDWSNGISGTNVINNLSAGTYSGIITDNVGCSIETGDLTILNTPGSLQVNVFKFNESCGYGDGSISLEVNGGTPEYTYSWSNGATTPVINNLSAGNYTFTVEDENGCLNSSTVMINNGSGTLSVDNAIITPTECNLSTGEIELTVSGGDGTYNYLWSTGEITKDISELPTGNYTLQLSDNSGCSLSQIFHVNIQGGSLSLSNSHIFDDYCNFNTGSIEVEIEGGTNYSFAWSNGATTQNITNLIAGTYTLEVSSDEGCFSIFDFEVLDDENCNLLCNDLQSSALSGTLYDSGGSTGDYSNNENCSFLIQPDCADEITLSFTAFATQNGWDFVRVYDGTDATGTLLLTASGVNLPPTITATSGAMFITFITSGSIIDSGFEAQWSTTLLSSSALADFTASSANPVFGEEVFFTDLSTGDVSYWSWDMTGDGIENYNSQHPSHIFTEPGSQPVTLTVTGCDGIENTFTQTVVVQDYPEVTITTNDPMSYVFSECGILELHTLTIQNTGNGDLMWEINHPNLIITPSSGSLSPGETTDVQITLMSYAFNGDYTENIAIASNNTNQSTVFHQIEIQQTINCATIMCVDTETTHLSGTLYDSGGPNGDYSNNENCSFLIQPNCADEITLSFNTFATQIGWDIISVYDGADATGTLLLTASGVNLPPTVTATSGAMFITFITNGFAINTGFEAQWSTTLLHSGSAFADFSASTTNPAFGEEVFFTDLSIGNVMSWSWDMTGDGIEDYNSPHPSHIFNTPGSHDVTLTVAGCDGIETTFTQTVIVQDQPEININTVDPMSYVFSECDDVYSHTLTIQNTGNGDLLWEINHPNLIISPSSGTLSPDETTNVQITLMSYASAGDYTENIVISANAPNQPTVFHQLEIQQTLNCTAIMCMDVETTNLSGTLYDSGGPTGNYSNSENCSFLIQPYCADEITLSFTTFATQNDWDVISVYDGTDATGPLLLTASGINLPPTVTATSGAMFITFITNGATINAGFEAQWSTTSLYGSVVADFSPSSTNPAFGEEVFFTNLSTGDVMSWSWDMTGDGIEDYTNQHPSHIFNTPGTYDVTLTATGCDGIESTFTQTVIIQDYPEFTFNTDDAMSYVFSECGEVQFHTLTIHNTGNGNLVWEINHPSLIITPSSGILSPGETTGVQITLMSYVNDGDYIENIAITSNDPGQPVVYHQLEIQQTVNCTATMCMDSETTNLSGTLYDSGGPNGDYSNNENCSFLIQPECADEITLMFTEFATQWGYDFIRIYDGTDATGNLLLMAGGYSLPATVTATSGAMFITFTTNESTVNTGFEAQWSTTLKSGTGIADFTTSTNNPAIGDEVYFTDLSTGAISSWSWDMTGDGIEDYTNQHPSHIFDTPGSHDVTLTTTDCDGAENTFTQTVIVQDHPEIIITTNDPMSYIFSGCNDNQLHTLTIENTGNGDLIWEINHPNLIIIPSSGTLSPGETTSVQITLMSYASDGDYIENITISSNDSDQPTVFHQLEIQQTVNCMAIMCLDVATTDPSGTLYDSGGPTGDYSNNENCSFLIQPDCADEITLTFNTFATQNVWDVIRVYDGTDATGTLLLITSGSNLPPTVTATSGAMFITFITNFEIINSGFEAQWSTTLLSVSSVADFTASSNNPEFGEEVFFTDLSTGDVTSWSWDMTGNGIEDYNSQHTSHIFTEPGSYDVSLTVSGCNGIESTYTETIIVQDYPEITITTTDPMSYVFSECGMKQLHTLTIQNTGNSDLIWEINHPSLFIIPNSGTLSPDEATDVHIILMSYAVQVDYMVNIAITSNDPHQPTVFHQLEILQTVNCTAIMCVDTATSNLSGLLYDSGGPVDPYNNNEDCSFLIQPDCAHEITLSFNSFNLENNWDYLSVYDGTDISGTLLLSATGFYTPPPVTATSGAMYIRIITNESFVSSGFEAEWSTTLLSNAVFQANFDIITTSPMIGDSVIFENTSIGDYDQLIWDFGDGNSITDSDIVSHLYDFEQECYPVSLTLLKESNCYSEVIQEVCFDENDNLSSSTFNMYPNPTSDFLNIEGIYISNIEVYNVMGAAVMVPISNHGELVYQLDFSKLQRATYFLRLNGDVYKIVKL